MSDEEVTPRKKVKIVEQQYAINNQVFDIMKTGFDKDCVSYDKMTLQKAKRGQNVKGIMEKKDVNLIIIKFSLDNYKLLVHYLTFL